MGLVHDLRARVSMARTYFWNKVQGARNLIYNVGLAVGHTRINALLQDYSLLPTIVHFPLHNMFDLR
jgi:hypothetical protein